MQEGDINLEIYTDNARIAIPKESIGQIKNDLYFRVIPIKEEEKKNEVEDRAKQEETVRKVAGSVNINVVGRPMTIETNMPNQPVDIILPLKGVTIPTEAKEREEFFNKLGVYIEHSDGEKVFIKGEVVPYKNGELGLKFTISKFSTFTILNMENGWDQKEPNFNDQFTGRTSEMELPVMADKVWNIKFNQAVKSSTVNNETVYMYDQNGEKVEIDIQLTNNTIQVSPKTYYKPDTKYYLYLSENIESSTGKRFVASERYVFKTIPYSLETGKWQEKNNVSPNKEWTLTFNANVKEALLTDEHIFVTNQHGSKVEVNVEVINSKSIKITPVKPYNNGESYYLFIKDLESENDLAMKNQIWMKFTVSSE
ncbi:Ig-like domain-containing protein [Ureibacillus xyleni]|uniref:Ig-like domain-containing protein n=2 Tax=Ureibacillus xyleni TaxID=614648 RepID=A0A285SX01_9BACL|nr:Ig-like domain-containing protein [Ureibacillus xyleni]